MRTVPNRGEVTTYTLTMRGIMSREIAEAIEETLSNGAPESITFTITEEVEES